MSQSYPTEGYLGGLLIRPRFGRAFGWVLVGEVSVS
jgi:hypothetical protein